MNTHYYEITISFDSGEQLIFADSAKAITLQDAYNNDFLIRSEDRTIGDNIKYTNLIKIFTGMFYSSAEEYNRFRTYCKNILKQLNTGDKVSNVFVKDNYGNVFYNITKNQIIGIDIEGTTEQNELGDNILLHRLLIYVNDGE